MGEEFLESRPTEKDLAILADEKLNMSQHCVLTAWKANGMVGFIRRVASTEKEVIVSLSSALVKPPLEKCIHARGPQYKENMKLLEMVKWLEQLSYEDKLKELQAGGEETAGRSHCSLPLLKGT